MPIRMSIQGIIHKVGNDGKPLCNCRVNARHNVSARMLVDARPGEFCKRCFPAGPPADRKGL